MAPRECNRHDSIVILLPQLVDLRPLLFGELVGLRGDAIMLSCADLVSDKVATSCLPVGKQLLTTFGVTMLWHVWFRQDGEVGMTEFDRPFVVHILYREWRDFQRWDGVTRAVEG